jgi:hypothetical protein
MKSLFHLLLMTLMSQLVVLECEIKYDKYIDRLVLYGASYYTGYPVTLTIYHLGFGTPVNS